MVIKNQGSEKDMNPNYPYLHWLITLIIAPFIPALYGLIFNPIQGQIIELYEVYLITFFVSVFFSIPTFIFYLWIFSYLSKLKIKLVLKKMILICCTVSGIMITFRIIGGSLNLTLVFSYSVAAIITGAALRIKARKELSQDFEMNI